MSYILDDIASRQSTKIQLKHLAVYRFSLLWNKKKVYLFTFYSIDYNVEECKTGIRNVIMNQTLI